MQGTAFWFFCLEQLNNNEYLSIAFFSLDNNLALRKDKQQFDICLEQLNDNESCMKFDFFV